MHDPKTVAFEIKNPFVWVKKGHYRPALITIWHVDPENFKFKDGTQKQGGRGDDSCGWSRPMYHIKEWENMRKVATYQYGEIFARQVASRKGESYAHVCNHPETTYEVIYWIWRTIKAHGRKGWQYGRSRNFLSSAELEQVMILATAPGDNFKNHTINDENSFIEMFHMIWNNYRRFHRSWYKHPRWHIHHWQIQFVFIRDIKRRYWDKCSVCGKRGFKGSAIGNWEGTKIWHSECDRSMKMPATVEGSAIQ